MLAQACEAGTTVACENLASMYENGYGVLKDPIRATTLYEQACDGGKASGCVKAGVNYVNGDGVPKDPARAAVLFKRACDAGSAVACLNLGIQYKIGNGVARDSIRAATLYKQSCDGGHAWACVNLGVLYADGDGVSKDPPRAAALWDQACQQDEPTGCQNRAIALRDGIGIEKDVVRAETLFRKACDRGHQEACQALGDPVFATASRMGESAERRQPSEPQEVCGRHILVKVESPAQAGRPEAKARSRAEVVLASVKAGADFADLAKIFSDDAGSASNGGELGCFSRGVLVPEFEDVAFALGVGETSDLVRTPFGFHVIQRMMKNKR
jgi:TPR repeat protein